MNYLNLKVVVIGNGGVGKSSLVNRYISDSFDPNNRFTIGVDICKKSIEIGDTVLTLTFFDTAGQEKYASMTNSYFKGAGACILVYDITSRSSFNDLEKWRNQLVELVNEKIPILVVGNKSDIAQQREVLAEDGIQYARKNDAFFIETSCLNGNNVNEAIDIIIKKIVSDKSTRVDTTPEKDVVQLAKPQVEQTKQGGCC